MTSRKIKALSVAAAAVALVTTLALARTVHTPTTAGEHAAASHGKVTGSTPSQSGGSHLRGIMTCGTTTSAQECERLEMLLPMNWRAPGSAPKEPVKI